ncbi:hypothetical protein DRW07_07795 [Alteromonas sediminis]|uniref:F5/8 type C domain-containing protein n=1 Tax=Alteromonas sediminis TaxID=2259342 RepID=A0A3N5Y0Z0_9ALTE|nr:discoidin domain-containing protein [Alteromonas sediminis]RPJ67417.1 hypothetical protein DRW07_07795 [Alteromonas sediminis]
MPIVISEIEQMFEQYNFVKFRGKSSGQPFVVSPDPSFRFLRFELQATQSINLDKIEIVDEDNQSLLKNAKIMVSSSYNDEARFDGQRLIDGAPTGGVSFHSKNEKNPWLVIDLGEVQKASKITITNRGGKYFYRALSFKLSCSSDLTHWQVIHDNYAFTESEQFLALSKLEQALIKCCTFNDDEFRSQIYRFGKKTSYEEAREYVDIVNHFLQQESLSYGPHGISETFEVRSEEKVNLAYQELSNLLGFLNKSMNISAFASSGTLLGIVRDGQFLAHDDDLDACYISNFSEQSDILKEREDIRTALTEQGYQVRNSNVAHFWVTTPNKITLDLFTGWVNEEGICMMNPLPAPGVGAMHITPTQVKNVQGFDIYLPRDPIPLLELNYGQNWANPDPLWQFDWRHAPKLYGFLYF